MASAAVRGSAEAAGGDSTPAATSTAPRARTARGRRGAVVRESCTGGLRLLRRARGRGHVPCASKRTVGNRCRQVAGGATEPVDVGGRACDEGAPRVGDTPSCGGARAVVPRLLSAGERLLGLQA